MFSVHISGWGWLAPFGVIIAYRILNKILPWHGVHWGGSNTHHPGWWLYRTEYVRAYRKIGGEQPLMLSAIDEKGVG